MNQIAATVGATSLGVRRCAGYCGRRVEVAAPFHVPDKGLPVLRLLSEEGAAVETSPPRRRDDLGNSDWEQALIKAVRDRGFLWRTEQTLPPVGGEIRSVFGSQYALEGRC